MHVPFCLTRCGYCDFNTYTAAELGSGASRETYAGLAIGEVGLAGRVLGGRAGPVSTVFFGGGTPTLLPVSDLAAILAAIGQEFGLADGAEVTVEANPETVDPRVLDGLRARRVHPDLAGHAERGAARAGRAGPGASAGAARAVRGLGPGGRVRARQPGPHLRHSGGDRRRLGAVTDAARSRPGPTTSRPTR